MPREDGAQYRVDQAPVHGQVGSPRPPPRSHAVENRVEYFVRGQWRSDVSEPWPARRERILSRDYTASSSPLRLQSGRARARKASVTLSGGGRRVGSSPGKARARSRVRTMPGSIRLARTRVLAISPA